MPSNDQSNDRSNHRNRGGSVVLLSGGLDSSACLAFLRAEKDEHSRPRLAITADYGHRAARREIERSRQLTEWAGVPHRVVDLTWLGKLGGSALTDRTVSVPCLKPTELDLRKITEETARQVWVPNRNGVLIAVAAAIAEAECLEAVGVGFNAEEAATFADNSRDFIERSNSALSLSTRTGIRVVCPTASMTKIEIVAQLKREVPDFPWNLIWSCYGDGGDGSTGRECGTCESCRRKFRALEQSG